MPTKKTTTKTSTKKTSVKKQPTVKKTKPKKKVEAAAPASPVTPIPSPIPTFPVAVHFIVDESGSMELHAGAVISGFNEYLTTLKARAAEQEFFLSLTKFSYHPTPVFNGVSLENVPQLSSLNYRPSGGTALYDAVVNGINTSSMQVRKTITPDGKQHKQSVLVVIMTDGEENSSRLYNLRNVQDLIRQKETEGNWTFVYLGANQDSWKVVQSWGLSIGNVANFNVANSGLVLQDMASYSCQYVNDTKSARSAGLAPMSNNFFDGSRGIRSVNIAPVAPQTTTDQTDDQVTPNPNKVSIKLDLNMPTP